MTNHKGLLTYKAECQALGRMSIHEMKGSGSWTKIYYQNQKNVKIPNSAYFEKCMSFNLLHCYKCMEQIEIGQEYQCVYKRARLTKYYHCSCFESMHY